MRRKNSGFTIIELMIVIVIIGILAAVALVVYQDYVVKAQLTRVYYEVNSVRTAIEEALNRGARPTVNVQLDNQSDGQGASYAYVGVNGGNARSNLIYSIVINEDSEGNFKDISAVFGKDALFAIRDVRLIMVRTDEGHWQCLIDSSKSSGWRDKYLLSNCKK